MRRHFRVAGLGGFSLLRYRLAFLLRCGQCARRKQRSDTERIPQGGGAWQAAYRRDLLITLDKIEALRRSNAALLDLVKLAADVSKVLLTDAPCPDCRRGYCARCKGKGCGECDGNGSIPHLDGCGLYQLDNKVRALLGKE